MSRDRAEWENQDRGLPPRVRAAASLPHAGLIRVSSESGWTQGQPRGQSGSSRLDLRHCVIEQRGRICPERSECVGGMETMGRGEDRKK